MAGIFFAMILLSITIAKTYMVHNGISLRSIIYDVDGDLSTDSWKFTMNQLDSSNDYASIFIEHSDTFDLKKNLNIIASTENIYFVEEDRQDIQIDYNREKPDSDRYIVSYSADSDSDSINVSATYTTKNLSISGGYSGSITIYLPYNYAFNSITLDTGAAKITSDNIYTNTKELSIIESFGDIQLELDQAMEKVILSCSFGSVDLTTQNVIKNLIVYCDNGDVDLETQNEIANLKITNNMGNISVVADSQVGTISISSDLGSVLGIFNAEVGNAEVNTSLGDITCYFSNNDHMSVYLNAETGSKHSDFDLVSSDSTNFSFSSNLGSIDLYKN